MCAKKEKIEFKRNLLNENIRGNDCLTKHDLRELMKGVQI